MIAEFTKHHNDRCFSHDRFNRVQGPYLALLSFPCRIKQPFIFFSIIIIAIIFRIISSHSEPRNKVLKERYSPLDAPESCSMLWFTERCLQTSSPGSLSIYFVSIRQRFNLPTDAWYNEEARKKKRGPARGASSVFTDLLFFN